MTTSIVGTIQEIVRDELRRVHQASLAVVEEVFPHATAGDDDNFACDLRLKNSGLLLRRVPIATGAHRQRDDPPRRRSRDASSSRAETSTSRSSSAASTTTSTARR